MTSLLPCYPRNKMISSLTLPQPTQPTLRHPGRRNMTIEWHSQFAPAVQDVTTFGFKIDVCHIPDNMIFEEDNTAASAVVSLDITNLESASGGLPLASSDKEGNNANGNKGKDKAAAKTTASSINQSIICRNITVLRPSINTYTQADKLIETPTTTVDGVTYITFATVVGAEADIQPVSYYFTRVTTLFNNFNSSPSVWSQVMQTLPLATPGQYPDLEYIRSLVRNAFQKQKEKAQIEATEKGKLMKRLPKPIQVNYTVEASYTHTIGLERHHISGALGTTIYLSFLRAGDDGDSNIIDYEVYGRAVSCDELLFHKDMTTQTIAECKASHNQLSGHLPPSWHLYHSLVADLQIINNNKKINFNSALYQAKSYIATHSGATVDVVTLQVNNLHLDTFYGKSRYTYAFS